MYNVLYIDDTKIKYKNKIYNVNIAFNRFLKAIDILEDKNLEEPEKVEYIFECFIDEKTKCNLVDKSNIVNKIFKNCNDILDRKKFANDEIVMDIRQDFEYIYSSFYLDYGIDLIEEFDKLSWIKFNALLSGLSKKTKMSEVIRIRTMDIPKATKHNEKERINIVKLKTYYALEQTPENFEKQIEGLFHVLKGMAKKPPNKPKKKKK